MKWVYYRNTRVDKTLSRRKERPTFNVMGRREVYLYAFIRLLYLVLFSGVSKQFFFLGNCLEAKTGWSPNMANVD